MRGFSGTVIVGVDGSQDAVTGLVWALRHAQVAGLTVCVVHAWLPDEDLEGGGPFPDDLGLPSTPALYGQRILRDRAMTEAAARDRVHAALAAASARVPIGRSLVTRTVTRGEPGAVLVEMSRDGAQLVVGATGSGALPGILTPALGSTTRFVLRHAWCPVTVVPSARLRSDTVARPAPAFGAVPPARAPGAGS